MTQVPKFKRVRLIFDRYVPRDIATPRPRRYRFVTPVGWLREKPEGRVRVWRSPADGAEPQAESPDVTGNALPRVRSAPDLIGREGPFGMDLPEANRLFGLRSVCRRGRLPSSWVFASALAILGVGGGCSRKLSGGGGALDVLAYDMLKMDRGTGYYFTTLQGAHDRTNFAYRASEDPFLADKCVDAIRHLGDAKYDRLEGEVQVILLLSDVLLEDPIVLAKIQSAEALTKLALELPVAPVPDRPERGDRYLAVLKELDGMHDDEGRRKVDTPATRQRVIQLFDEIGSYRFPKLLDTKNGLRFFPARRYVTAEVDPALREAIDRAMVRRSRAVVLVSLTDAVQESSSAVREAALRGLKTLAVADALESVIDRIPVESSGLVRIAIADYLGAIGGPAAVKALVGLLDDDDASVRHHAHEALVRTSGRDLGRETLAWAAFADGRPVPTPRATGSGTAPALAGVPGPSAATSATMPPAPPEPTVLSLPPTPVIVPLAPAPRPSAATVVPPLPRPSTSSEASGLVPAPLPPPAHRIVEGR